MKHLKTLSISWGEPEITIAQILAVVGQMMSVVGASLLSKEAAADDDQ
ncbi:MAG: hypothetical protein KA184_18895 [Candidatus Hydrogenedentes bacterium]|nr:hypothetical protein [Candidatus Hydrogenedentota bacterium]